MRRYSSGVPFWGIRVPKIEATARTINRGIVSRTEDRAAQREGKNPFSFSVDNGYLRTKNTKLNRRDRRVRRVLKKGIMMIS
jgi:hypothetical protein